MTKKIFEELPARKTPPAAAPMAQGGDKKDSGDSEKRIKQAVYDIRYRAKQSGMDLRAAFAQYMSGSKLSAQEQAVVKAKLFGKGKAVKEVKEGMDAASRPLPPAKQALKDAKYAKMRG